MFKIEFFDPSDVDERLLKYAVIVTKFKSKWIFVRHEERSTWEIPGGRREYNEKILETAERELVEETGAKAFNLKPISIYSVTNGNEKSYGLLCYAEIIEFGNPLCMEICEIAECDSMPENLTYPSIQPHLFEKVLTSLSSNIKA